ncbi:uncharacterized protein LOC128669973 [Plodia interpunctella]|uniref:uncharacterized protein LOC128669973 n=1 Tax=Plodia interpunctella TaxID=58824 RepID=UPI0023689C10|nr:uncharacterized protein LOC128669973 [Plodia interpunctella]
MWQYIVLLVCVMGTLCRDDARRHNIDSDLVLNLRDDANLDLSTDYEYEDLRAELLASHTVLAKLVESDEERRRSQKVNQNARRMWDTPCWNRSGICVSLDLCTGFNYLTEIPGCKEKLKVCCFVWNQFHVRDMREFGLSNIAMPWSLHEEFGGDGVVAIDRPSVQKKTRRPKNRKKLRKENFTEHLENKAIELLLRYDNKPELN